MGVGDRDGVGVGISAVGAESPCATPCPPFSRRACGCVDGRSVVDGMAAHVPSVTHEVESRQLQGRNVVQGAMRNVEGGSASARGESWMDLPDRGRGAGHHTGGARDKRDTELRHA